MVKILKVWFATGLVIALACPAAAQPAPGVTDADIFNFALNLESLETEYYLRGTTGKGMDAADAGTMGTCTIPTASLCNPQ